MVPLAAFGDSVRALVGAIEAFLSSLAAVSWGPLALGLLLHAAYLTLRSRGWFNALRAAYPAERFRWRNIWAAYVSAVGVNSVVPARPGAVVRLYLTRQTIPRSSYAAIASSFLIEIVFDIPVAVAVVAYAISQGVFPSLPGTPSLPAFDLGYLTRNPELTLFGITLLGVGVMAAVAVLSVRVRAFWSHVRQGLTVLGDRRRWLRQVVVWQAAGWLARIAGFWFMLEAFGIEPSVRNALLVMAVQGLSTLFPFTPGGAGAQQALLAVVFAGVAGGGQLAAYAVGQQVAIAGFSFALGLAALAFVFRTTDWRSIVRRGRADREGEENVTAV